MKRSVAFFGLATLTISAALAARLWANQSAALSTISKAAIGQAQVADVKLFKPGKSIVTQVPIAFEITESIDSVTHTTQYLLGPNPGSSDPAKGWFILEPNEPPVFYLEHGFVYMVHEKEPPGGTPTAENTRPRVRTRRFVAAGEGTIMIAQVGSEIDRSFAIESAADVTALITTGSTELSQGQYCTANEAGELSDATSIAGNPEPEQFVEEIYDIAKTFEMDTP